MNFEDEEKDHFLFAQMRLGNEAAFDFIFRKYYKLFVIQAIRLVHDQDSAQSLVQDCFIRFWEKRHDLSAIENLYAYLFFMVRNRCLDHIRAELRTHQVPITHNTDFTEYVTEQTIDNNDLEFHLWHAIAKLPERSRLAFEYSRIDGLTYQQIALKMNISPKAVEALISRALRQLRSKLIDFMCIIMMILNP